MNLLYTAHVPSGEGPFPTVLAVHGFGASAHDLIGLAPILHGGRALVLCPQGPVALQPGPGMIGYGWFPLSQGGFMAYQIALSDPARFAGLMALSAWLPDEVEKIAPQPAHAALPTLVIHGSKDPMVPIDRAYASRDALLRLKVPTVFREYEMAHEIRPEALRDIIGWLEQKVLAPVAIA